MLTTDILCFSVCVYCHVQFQPLYVKMPMDIAWSEILISCAETDQKNKAQQQAKANKQKEKNKLRGQQQLQYDPSLVCYFNPTEYAAAMGLYTGPPQENGGAEAALGAAAGEKASAPAVAVNPIEEAVIAKRRLAT